MWLLGWVHSSFCRRAAMADNDFLYFLQQVQQLLSLVEWIKISQSTWYIDKIPVRVDSSLATISLPNFKNHLPIFSCIFTYYIQNLLEWFFSTPLWMFGRFTNLSSPFPSQTFVALSTPIRHVTLDTAMIVPWNILNLWKHQYYLSLLMKACLSTKCNNWDLQVMFIVYIPSWLLMTARFLGQFPSCTTEKGYISHFALHESSLYNIKKLNHTYIM